MKHLFAAALFALSGNVAATTVPEAVLRNAPVYVSRRDQVKNPKTDRILALGYSTLASPTGEMVIRYTTFFSDEDSAGSKSATDRLMARYGRRLDVEWTYEVTLDPKSGAAIGRRYQCDVLLGIGHRTCVFRGSLYRDTDRPILYVNARHNTFGDRPKFPYGTKHGRLTVMDPTLEIPYPMSRDLVPVLRPEMLRTSDEELRREGKLSRPSTEYAFLRVRGSLAGKLRLSITDPSGKVYRNGGADDALRDLGLDLWGKESVVAIALPAEVRARMKTSFDVFRLGAGTDPALKSPGRLRLEDVGLYVVDRAEDGRYETTDLSARIRCEDPTDLNTCALN